MDSSLVAARKAHLTITEATKDRNMYVALARERGFTYREIAEALQISSGTVSQILSERSRVRERKK